MHVPRYIHAHTMHRCMHMCTHARTHARTHTHKHIHADKYIDPHTVRHTCTHRQRDKVTDRASVTPRLTCMEGGVKVMVTYMKLWLAICALCGSTSKISWILAAPFCVTGFSWNTTSHGTCTTQQHQATCF